MARYSKDRFIKDLAIYSAGGIIGVTGTRKMFAFALKQGINLAAFAGSRVAPPVARGALGVGRAALGGAVGYARKNPYVAVGTGLYFLNETGQLEEVKETVRDFNAAGMQNVQEEFIQPAKERVKRAKKRVNKFAKAVGAGVKAVKLSKFQGPVKKLTNPKKTFAAVTKIASKVNAGKKVKKTGATGVISKAVSKVLGRFGR